MKIEDHGISVDIPPGWEGELSRRPSAAGAPDRGPGPAAAAAAEVSHPVLHVASYALPVERGDFGSGAVEQMSPGDVLVCVLEYDGESASTPLFAHDGIPRVRARDFAPDAMQRPLPGRVGLQRFFHVGERAFCLYVVLHDDDDRPGLVGRVNSLLATLRID